MSDQFLGEIRCVGFDFAPVGWATCDGQLLLINQNPALYSLAGVSFGGNGTSNFGLPNLQGAAPLGWGQGSGLSNYNRGDRGGEQQVTLSLPQAPLHSHNLQCDEQTAKFTDPGNNLAAGIVTGNNLYSAAPTDLTNYLAPPAVYGGSQPHNNMAPYLTMLFIVALTGDYPPKS